MESRSAQFLQIEIKAAHGERLTRGEHDLLKEYLNLTRQVGPPSYESTPT